FLGQGRRGFASGQLLGHFGELGQGPVDETHADGRTDERQQQGRDAPAEPFYAGGQAQLFAIEDQPVLVTVDFEAYPYAGGFIDRPHDLRAGPKPFFDLGGDVVPVVGVGQGFEPVGFFAGLDAQAFFGGQVEQQGGPDMGGRIDQRRARDADRR